MRASYIFIIVLVLIIAVVVAFLPEKDNSELQVPADDLHYDLVEDTRFYSTDKIADLLINEDPSIQLIDVRGQAAYDEYHLPGAICIPLGQILESKWKEELDQNYRKNVFYSNGTVAADQAWMICRRKGYENNFVMKGGLNRWVGTILRPELPSPTETDVEVLDRYQFRKAASQYFGGGEKVKVEPEKVDAPEPVIIKKRKETEVAGGC